MGTVLFSMRKPIFVILILFAMIPAITIRSIGDSIRIGCENVLGALLSAYTVTSTGTNLYTQNNKGTQNVLDSIRPYIMNQSFDVLLINCGAWDIRRSPNGTYPCATDTATYRANLRKIFDSTRVSHPSAKIFFRATTPFDSTQQETIKWLNSDVVRYNAIARSVVENYSDGYYLDTYTDEMSSGLFPSDIQSDGVHRTVPGNNYLGNAIYRQLMMVLDPDIINPPATLPKRINRDRWFFKIFNLGYFSTDSSSETPIVWGPQ